MRKTAIALIVLLSLLSVSAFGQDFTEKARIQYLIESVEALEGAKFIRNGREYDARAASSHLRLKLTTLGDRVRTAEDFINLCASRSSMTGKPYVIILADGSRLQSEAFFRSRLQRFVPNKP